MSSSESQEAMRKAAEEGKTSVPAAQAKYAAEQAAEAARVAGLPPDQLPEGAFATQAEAEAYLAQQRAAGKEPQVIDDGTGTSPYTIEIPSPYHGGTETIWITAVPDAEA